MLAIKQYTREEKSIFIMRYIDEIELEQEEKAKQKPKKIVKEVEKEEDDYEL